VNYTLSGLSSPTLSTHVPHIHIHRASTGVRGEEVEEEVKEDENGGEGISVIHHKSMGCIAG